MFFLCAVGQIGLSGIVGTTRLRGRTHLQEADEVTTAGEGSFRFWIVADSGPRQVLRRLPAFQGDEERRTDAPKVGSGNVKRRTPDFCREIPIQPAMAALKAKLLIRRALCIVFRDRSCEVHPWRIPRHKRPRLLQKLQNGRGATSPP
jgi:hypothetical protein